MKSKSKLILNILTIIGIVAVIFFIYFAVKERWFLDNEILLTKIKSFGLLAPLCFILIQIVQVVLPVIPGGASCLVGVMAFGAVGGFIYNYVGLVLGSICSFLLSRKFGMSIINKLFKEKDIKKALDKINNSKYDLIFFLIIIAFQLKKTLWVSTDRTHGRSGFSDANMTAVSAYPYRISVL